MNDTDRALPAALDATIEEGAGCPGDGRAGSDRLRNAVGCLGGLFKTGK